MTDCSAALEVYTLEEILELNDLTTEEVLIYLIDNRVIVLPEVIPVEL